MSYMCIAVSVCWSLHMLTLSIWPSYCIECIFSSVTTTSTSSPCGVTRIFWCISVLCVISIYLAIGKRWVRCTVSWTRKRVWFTGIIHSAVIRAEQCISNFVVYWWSLLYWKAWHIADWYVWAWLVVSFSNYFFVWHKIWPIALHAWDSEYHFRCHSVKNGMFNDHLLLPDC